MSNIPPDENPFASNPTPEANPFRAPAQVQDNVAPQGVDPVVFHGSGYIRQVTGVSIFMIIQGLLLCLMAAGLLFMGVTFQNLPQDPNAPEFEAMRGPMSMGFNIAGALIILVGLLLVVAGIRNLSFRSRTLGIVAMSVNILAAFTVYCAPTALALAIWGLIVYLNPSVARAFQLCDSGTSAADIRQMARK